MWAAAAMLALTAGSLWLAWRPATRLFGVCLFLFVATILFRVTYLIPEFMPEYRIYPGMPWFCLGAAIFLAAAWRAIAGNRSPILPASLLVLTFSFLSAKRSFAWHDLDTLNADTLKQYPAQARAVWELQERDLKAGHWQKVIDRHQQLWPQVFQRFLAENQRLAPRRELPSGHFALADVGCAGCFAIARMHVHGPAAGLAEIQRLELYMTRLGLGRESHRIHWSYFFKAKGRILEETGNYQAALDIMRSEDFPVFSPRDIQRVEKKLAAALSKPRH